MLRMTGIDDEKCEKEERPILFENTISVDICYVVLHYRPLSSSRYTLERSILQLEYLNA